MPRQKKEIIIGPFATAAKNIEDLSNNIFMSYLYEQTINELLRAEEELSTALQLQPSGSQTESLKEKVFFLIFHVIRTNKSNGFTIF